MSRFSGLQRDVLSLYRSFLRMTRNKPASTRDHFVLLARYTFHMNANAISKRDVGTIEHLLRRGRRQLEMYSDPGVKDCTVSDQMRQWAEQQKQRHSA